MVDIGYNTKFIEKFMSPFIEMLQQKYRKLKDINKPTVGWFSIYTPEEIIYAAGMIPFRIIGEELSVATKARALLFSNLCPYVLSCLDEGLESRYSSLNGVVIVNTCDARRRLYDAWRRFIKTRFIHLIDLPKTITKESKQYFTTQICLFKEALEKEFGIKITPKSLSEAIELWNKTRGLLHQLYGLRKDDNPPITGSQALSIIKASMAGQREEFNRILLSLLNYLEDRGREVKNIPPNHKRTRILITGSYFDQNSLVELIENLGTVVVCEDLSNGIKYFEGKVDPEQEPISALADYYLSKATCARMADSQMRYDHLKILIKTYKIDAVIYFSLKFCDNNLIDFPYQRQRLIEDGIPVLFIEGERILVNINQLKTRIQAFLEML
jgi:benzoyl-CoA reductase/2-hydroxyglutaryl-CoA dehydratase subunit BcrC/BadD/HgdB